MVNDEEVVGEIGAKFLPRLKVENDIWRVDASGLPYRDLNSLLRALSNNGAKRIEIDNVYGQRYIGTDLDTEVEIEIRGTPGNDLGAFMHGPKLIIHGNAQDGCGNTMNDGRIIVYGRAGDITGYSMRGGKIFIRDDVGYRAGIHMKEYKDQKPSIVIGGTAQDFLGEYMAGGTLVLLCLNSENGKWHQSRFIGTGMHGGKMYIRGELGQLGKETEPGVLEEDDRKILGELVQEFCSCFGLDAERILDQKFSKVIPVSHRPYGELYAY